MTPGCILTGPLVFENIGQRRIFNTKRLNCSRQLPESLINLRGCLFRRPELNHRKLELLRKESVIKTSTKTVVRRQRSSIEKLTSSAPRVFLKAQKIYKEKRGLPLSSRGQLLFITELRFIPALPPPPHQHGSWEKDLNLPASPAFHPHAPFVEH